MTPVSSQSVTTAAARCLQVLQMAMGTISVALKSAVVVIKSTYQQVWPQRAKSLEGEVVLVTGAGHGIGRHLALEFCEKRSTVICVDIDERSNQFTARAINTRHRHRLEANGATAREERGPAHAYTCDVTDRNQVAELALRILKDVGRVDILVNNVGFSPVRQMQAPEAIDVVNVNLLSHFWTVLAFLPGMVERKHGHVVAILPGAGLCQLSNKVPYATIKYAITGLMDALSEELCPNSHNIKLTCVHPNFVHTQSDLPDSLDLRIPELSPQHAAKEIVSAVQHNKEIVTVPSNLLFWLNVLQTLPQDMRDIWQDLFHGPVTPTVTQSATPYHSEVASNGIKT